MTRATPATRRSQKLTSTIPDGTSILPVCPRETRAIIPRQSIATHPTVNACSASGVDITPGKPRRATDTVSHKLPRWRIHKRGVPKLARNPQRHLRCSERAVRGAERDYVIDYVRGTVTFTYRRLITAESTTMAEPARLKRSITLPLTPFSTRSSNTAAP